MPAVPAAPAGPSPKASKVPPLQGLSGTAGLSRSSGSSRSLQHVSHQPAPGIVLTSSETTHVLDRRFIGPMPEHILNSDELQGKRRRFQALRRSAVDKFVDAGKMDGITMVEGFRVGGTSNNKGRMGKAVRIVRVRRRNKQGKEVEQDVEVDSDEGGSDDWSDDDITSSWWSGGTAGKKGKGKKKRKKRSDVWIGESFDIGREFKEPRHPAETSQSVNNGQSFNAGPSQTRKDGLTGPSGPNGHMSTEEESPSTKPSSQHEEDEEELVSPVRPAPTTRPSTASKSTQDSFVTARTDQSWVSAASSTHDLPASDGHLLALNGSDPKPALSPTGSLLSPADVDSKSPKRHSGSSSTQPLLDGVPPRDNQSKGKAKAIPNDISPTLQKKLRSAMRKSSRTLHATSTRAALSQIENRNDALKPNGPGGISKSKSVQFPLDPVDHLANGTSEPLRKGNKAPADPGRVLAREGDQVEGTSAGAAESAMGDEDDDEDFVPGQIIMRDRMLVKVAYHRSDGIAMFDEATQRRDPVTRLERFEEYMVTWRKGKVEFYQDYLNPLQRSLNKGNLRLCFMVPLLPNRTSLSIFNQTDMSLSLTTSAGRLSQDFESGTTRSTSTRSATYKHRVRNSKQAQWLRTGRKGTHIFIMKLGERSRALDWFWELWRELGGELPPRFDISIPSFSSSVRMLIPEGEDMVGDKAVCAALNAERVVERCKEMVGQAIDIEQIMRERKEATGEGDPNLKLAWKAGDGTLEWISQTTTVTGKSRDWDVLAGVALNTGGDRCPRVLQLRQSRHQARSVRLEDGDLIIEPPGVEGYLVRHRSTSTPKEHVYLSTHDGNIIASTTRHSKPPVKPSKEGSTPVEVFPQVYKAFRENEQRRLASGITDSAGCIDLRAIDNVRLVVSKPDPTEQPPPADEGDQIPSGPSNTGATPQTPEHSPSRRTRKGSRNSSDHQNETSPATLRSSKSVISGLSTSSKPPGSSWGAAQPRDDRCFEVDLMLGGTVRFEAHTIEDAKEWVTRLSGLINYWKRRHRIDARLRMDAVSMHEHNDPFTGTELSNHSDALLGDVWDWCVIDGCRSVTSAGRLFLKKGRTEKFRPKYAVLTGGSLVTFKIKSKVAFHPKRHVYPLFGSYAYSGMLAQEELYEENREDYLGNSARVYQDGLQSSDGSEDTTFCVRLALSSSQWSKKSNVNPWDLDVDEEAASNMSPDATLKGGGKIAENLGVQHDFHPPPMRTKSAQLLIFRARSKLERDRWVWAINAEMERQTRAHIAYDKLMRDTGRVPA